ncbi:IS3 family transposase [Mycoplasmopsis felis]|uniref:IS3 family transposase n=1 Tax=Mycoplasmopsis felis TaxID=33923 RepID=UPI002AFE62E0|nr:IS3 family transposase [Mycoplasmopsis felis]WQQ04372.1 IS3 family transposase [Mycoplasmopsis felis]
MEDLLVTKRSNLRKKGSGRPRKNKEPNWEIFNRDDIVEIAKRYYEITNKLPKSKQIKESKELNLNYFKLENLFNLCRQAVSKNKRNEYLSKLPKYSEIIPQAFEETKERYGREKLSVYILQKYKKYINPRSLGRYMNLLGLKCKVRQKKKRKEIKDTNTQIENLVKRDYDDKENRNIFATDVSYIKSPKDVLESFVYLSAILSHKTKEIIGFKLSKSNNLDLDIQNLEYLTKKKYSNFIIHSDHGFQYTNQIYIDKVKKSNGKVSLSRIGNSLDNREIEYWFCIIKTELLNDLDYSEITFDELNLKIKEYVDWYNKERIQSNLEWKTPQQTAMML